MGEFDIYAPYSYYGSEAGGDVATDINDSVWGMPMVGGKTFILEIHFKTFFINFPGQQESQQGHESFAHAQGTQCRAQDHRGQLHSRRGGQS